MRHGKPTVHSKWDNSTAILAGDGIFAIAQILLCSLPNRANKICQFFNQTTLELCEGQALDFQEQNLRAFEDFIRGLKPFNLSTDVRAMVLKPQNLEFKWLDSTNSSNLVNLELFFTLPISRGTPTPIGGGPACEEGGGRRLPPRSAQFLNKKGKTSRLDAESKLQRASIGKQAKHQAQKAAAARQASKQKQASCRT